MMKILKELRLIRKELQNIREVLESAMLPHYKVEVKDGKPVRVPLDREAALKELRK